MRFRSTPHPYTRFPSSFLRLLTDSPVFFLCVFCSLLLSSKSVSTRVPCEAGILVGSIPVVPCRVPFLPLSDSCPLLIAFVDEFVHVRCVQRII